MIEVIEGDCEVILDKLEVEGRKYDCIVMDPPYSESDFYDKPNLKSLVPKLYRLLKDNCILYVFGEGGELYRDFAEHYSRAFKILWDMVLVRQSGIPPMSGKHVVRKHHTLLAMYRKGDKIANLRIRTYFGERTDKIREGGIVTRDNKMFRDSVGYVQSVFDVGFIPQTKEYVGHPNQKPLSLMTLLIKMVKDTDNFIVLDPFAGSGTTGVACRILGANATLIEIKHEYVEMIRKRLEETKCTIDSFT